MKKYLVITNIWGKKPNPKCGDLLREVFKEEKEYFDTKAEANEYITLFEEICKTYDIPAIKSKGGHKDIFPNKIFYDFKSPNERAWGWVLGDVETCTVLKWGGLGMYNISKKDNTLRVKDYLFRGKDEIPENYKWDNGEYEGWLQYRWGDGKNAIGYVEPEKPAKPKEEEYIDKEIESIKEWENDAEDYDKIENSFAKHENKEKLKILAERW